jgi:hypothetical protein
MDNDVGAELDGAGEIGRREGRIHDERQTMGMGHVRHGFEIDDLERRVRDALTKHGAGPVVDGSGDVLWIVRVDERSGDTERRQDVVEHRVGAAVQVAGRHDVVASLGQVDHRIENGARS